MQRLTLAAGIPALADFAWLVATYNQFLAALGNRRPYSNTADVEDRTKSLTQFMAKSL